MCEVVPFIEAVARFGVVYPDRHMVGGVVGDRFVAERRGVVAGRVLERLGIVAGRGVDVPHVDGLSGVSSVDGQGYAVGDSGAGFDRLDGSPGSADGHDEGACRRQVGRIEVEGLVERHVDGCSSRRDFDAHIGGAGVVDGDGGGVGRVRYRSRACGVDGGDPVVAGGSVGETGMAVGPRGAVGVGDLVGPRGSSIAGNLDLSPGDGAATVVGG